MMPVNAISNFREQALRIASAGLDAVKPGPLMFKLLADATAPLRRELSAAPRILVVGAGKAGAAMSAALEEAMPELLPKVAGLVNVPADTVQPLRAIELHAARPAGVNFPTADGVAGSKRILDLVAQAGPEDVCLCLLSGGGSALLPAPVDGITLEDKQALTRLLHSCGATINEMNCVRKHLSAIKGGRLAQAFTGRALHALIISDVVGDPLDVIASGPTVPDPTTFADAIAVLKKFDVWRQAPAPVRQFLEEGGARQRPDTLKESPGNVHTHVLGNNALALAAAADKAREYGFAVLNLGSCLEGETSHVAGVLAGVARSVRAYNQPFAPPACILSGGETTVTLDDNSGKGGRNQEFVLASLVKLASIGMRDFLVLSLGTDGEDGPTDAAGAMGDLGILESAANLGLEPARFLANHDAYHFFDKASGLVKTGLTQTNVMDLRLTLVW